MGLLDNISDGFSAAMDWCGDRCVDFHDDVSAAMDWCGDRCVDFNDVARSTAVGNYVGHYFIDNTMDMAESAGGHFADGDYGSGLCDLSAGITNAFTGGGISALADKIDETNPDMAWYLADHASNTALLGDAVTDEWKNGNYFGSGMLAVGNVINVATFGGGNAWAQNMRDSNIHVRDMSDAGTNLLFDGDASNDLQGLALMGHASERAVEQTGRDLAEQLSVPSWWKYVWGRCEASAVGSAVIAGGKIAYDKFKDMVDVTWSSYKEQGMSFSDVQADVKEKGQKHIERWTEYQRSAGRVEEQSRKADQELGDIGDSSGHSPSDEIGNSFQ